MTQTTYLPGHLITIRLYNQPLAQALLDAGIAVEPDTSGVRFACRADPKGTIEVRYGWEEAKELTGYGLAEALKDLTPADKGKRWRRSCTEPMCRQATRGAR